MRNEEEYYSHDRSTHIDLPHRCSINSKIIITTNVFCMLLLERGVTTTKKIKIYLFTLPGASVLTSYFCRKHNNLKHANHRILILLFLNGLSNNLFTRLSAYNALNYNKNTYLHAFQP